jgi:ABC-type transport system involved in multi-copper enzyme maturation permease subunit
VVDIVEERPRRPSQAAWRFREGDGFGTSLAPRTTIMLPGPVFVTELITTARRSRYYLLRVIYGLFLFFIVYANYQGFTSRSEGVMSPQKMTIFADAVFASFAVYQATAVLVLTPALVGGVIADEKQRKTLHYLLSSRLSSAEIVLGKLAARLLHLTVFLSIALPVMSLLGLFGGVDPLLVLLTYAGTFSTAFFLAGVAIWVSTVSRTVRDAVASTYMLEILWLILPPLVELLTQIWWPSAAPWIRAANDWISATHPFAVLTRVSGRFGPGGGLNPVFWMIGLQWAYGSLFVLLAIVRLRPVFRAQGNGRRWFRLGAGAGARRWQWRLLPRPECGDEPMLWKERYVSRTGGLVKLLRLIVAVIGASAIGYWLIDLGASAFRELARDGYGGGPGVERARFNAFLRGVGCLLYVLWMLAAATAAAASIASERESDTWTSLIATPLEGYEILRAKMLGAVWGSKVLVIVLVLLWTIGLLAGAVHPFGFFAVLVELVVFTWFAVALGTYYSLHAKSTLRAQAMTVGWLFALNLGYLMCCLPFQPDTLVVAFGSTPFIEAISLCSYQDVAQLFRSATEAAENWQTRAAGEVFAAGFLSLVVYGLAAFGLTATAFSTFDRVVDRPRRPDDWLPLGEGSRSAKPLSKASPLDDSEL